MCRIFYLLQKMLVRRRCLHVAKGEPKLAYKVVLDLTREICGNGHITNMDNFLQVLDFSRTCSRKQFIIWALYDPIAKVCLMCYETPRFI